MSLLGIGTSLGENTTLLFLLSLWVLPWKGVALWKAAKNLHKKWFIAMFLLNTLAVLEIIYIFYFSKRRGDETKVSSSSSSAHGRLDK